MDLVQMAAALAEESGGSVMGPWPGKAQDMIHIMRPDGYGVALMTGPGKALSFESRPGGLDVWHIRKIDGSHLIDMSNTRDMIRYDTDMDGAREAMREAGPAVWVKKDTPPARCETCGR